MVQEVLDRGIINIGNQYRFHKIFTRLSNNEKIKIAFLGGSITQDCNVTTHELCYAYRTYDWFKRNFPAAEIEYINAGIGATTSELGVARVQTDVLDYKPDVVFIEFSVNDTNNEKFMETYESLIRKVLLSETKPAVFTFNNVQYDDGINAQEVHNKIGRFYELPIVSMKDSIYSEILFGNFTSADITTDNLHPNNTGHGLLSEVITNLLQFIYNQFNIGNIETEEYIVPEETVTPCRYIDSERIRNDITNQIGFISNDITVDDREQYGVKDCFKKGIIFNSAESNIQSELIFKGLSVQYLKHPGTDSMVCSVYIDDEFVAKIDGNFDETWGDCLYLQNIIEYDKSSAHTVKICVDNKPENCEQNFYFVSFITY